MYFLTVEWNELVKKYLVQHSKWFLGHFKLSPLHFVLNMQIVQIIAITHIRMHISHLLLLSIEPWMIVALSLRNISSHELLRVSNGVELINNRDCLGP